MAHLILVTKQKALCTWLTNPLLCTESSAMREELSGLRERVRKETGSSRYIFNCRKVSTRSGQFSLRDYRVVTFRVDGLNALIMKLIRSG
jgi:hypothetical protein